MRDLTEKKLLELGFEKIHDKDNGEKYHYFVFELYNGECLITQQCSNEVVDGLYDVGFYYMSDCPSFDNSLKVAQLLALLKSE